MQKVYRKRNIMLEFSILLNMVFIFIIAFQMSGIIDKYFMNKPIQVALITPPQIVEVVYTPVVSKELPVYTEREKIDFYIQEISAKYAIDNDLISSIIYHESRFKPDAKNGKCLGLMQVCTTWHTDRAAKLGVEDFFDPYGNILLGVDYISELMKANNNDVGLVLMLYNMDHKTARQLNVNGELSSYASSVLKRVDEIKQGVS